MNEQFLLDNFINLFKKSKIKCIYIGYDKLFKMHNYKVTVTFEGKQYTLNYYKSGDIGPSHYEIIDYLINNALRMSKIPSFEIYIKELSLGFNIDSYESNEVKFKNYKKDFLNTVRLFGESKILNYQKCIDFIYSDYNYLKFDKFISNYKKALLIPNVELLLVNCDNCGVEFYTSAHNRESLCGNCISEMRGHGIGHGIY